MKNIIVILFSLYSGLSLAGRVTVELTGSLTLRTEDQNGHLEKVIDLPRGSVISYDDGRRVSQKEFVNDRGDLMMSSRGWFRSILIHSTPARISRDEIERINDLPLFISQGVVSISRNNGVSGFNEQQRQEMIEEVMRRGKRVHATTTLDLPGGRFEVFNDALKTADGTYVNLTFGESLRIAREWNCRLPNRAQAQAIRDYARSQDSVFTARTHLPNNDAQKYINMQKMINDSEMKRRSEIGKTKLINGHFKWYIDDGSGNFKFFGFYYPSSCTRTGYCQNGGSGGHGNSWADYSQTARIICPK
jgi:hypothetical protein